MSVKAFDWAEQQLTSDNVAKATLIALGALADPDHKSRVNVDELAETIEHPPHVVREILAELEADALIECVHPLSSAGNGVFALQLERTI